INALPPQRFAWWRLPSLLSLASALPASAEASTVTGASNVAVAGDAADETPAAPTRPPATTASNADFRVTIRDVMCVLHTGLKSLQYGVRAISSLFQAGAPIFQPVSVLGPVPGLQVL